MMLNTANYSFIYQRTTVRVLCKHAFSKSWVGRVRGEGGERRDVRINSEVRAEASYSEGYGRLATAG